MGYRWGNWSFTVEGGICIELSQKLRMEFRDFRNKLQYEPAEVKYYFKDLQCALPEGSAVDVTNTLPSRAVHAGVLSRDMLRAEKAPGILSRAKTIDNLMFPDIPVKSIIQRVLSKIVLPAGDPLENHYDAGCRLARTRYPDGISIAYRYDDLGRRSRAESTGGPCTDIRYDARGRLAKISHSSQGDFSYYWNARDRLEKIRYPDGNTVNFGYGDNGALSGVEYDNEKISLKRDKSGRVIGAVINGNIDFSYPGEIRKATFGIHWHRDRDGVEKVTTPVGIFIRENGRIKAKIGIDGQVTAYRYGASGDLEAVWNNSGAAVVDGPSSMIFSDGTRSLRVFDPQRPIVYTIYPSSVSMEGYDADKKTVTFVDDSGVRAVNKYDKAGSLINIDNPVEGKTQLDYNGEGRISRIVIRDVLELSLDYVRPSGKIASVTGDGPISAVMGSIDNILTVMFVEGVN